MDAPSPTAPIAKFAKLDGAACSGKRDAIRYQAAHAVLRAKAHWADIEHRQAYVAASVEQGIAWQIKLNRELRGLSQSELAELIHSKQSAISRMEDPTYGCHSLKKLLDIARVFDCALSVKLISYSELAVESQRLSEFHQYALPFDLESEKFCGKELEHTEE